MKQEQRYPLGLALSGGGAKGFAHLGVLQAMEEIGLKPDIIAGTSAGALAGVLYADGYAPAEIASLFEGKEFRDFAAFSVPQAGLFKSHKFHDFLNKYIRAKNFEDLHIPLKIVATNFEHGVFKVFETGPLITSVIASCSYPILFSPIEIDGIHYVDGGLFKNFPVSVIRKECDKIIGVNVSPLALEKYKNSLLHIIERSFQYMSSSNSVMDRNLCDILIESTRVSKYPTFTLNENSLSEIYKIGYETAKKKFAKENLSKK